MRKAVLVTIVNNGIYRTFTLKRSPLLLLPAVSVGQNMKGNLHRETQSMPYSI